MKEEIENYEENGKPIWNKSAIWDQIEEKIAPEEKTVLLFPWLKFAAACGLLLMGLWWITNQASHTNLSTRTIADHQTEIEYINKTDTVYITQTIQNNTIVNQIKTKTDTVYSLPEVYTIRDTVLITKEIYVTSPILNDSNKTQKTKQSNSDKIHYSFNEPFGDYSPKIITSFQIFNKEPLPKGNQVKQTFIVLK